MALNLIWPRQAIYNAIEPFHWYLKWGAVLFIGIVMLGGFAYYWFVQRHKTGTLATHVVRRARRPGLPGGADGRRAGLEPRLPRRGSRDR